MTIRRDIAFQQMFPVSSFKCSEHVSWQHETRNEKPRSSIPQRSESGIAAEVFMDYAG
jgi:hypothetical protein